LGTRASISPSVGYPMRTNLWFAYLGLSKLARWKRKKSKRRMDAVKLEKIYRPAF